MYEYRLDRAKKSAPVDRDTLILTTAYEGEARARFEMEAAGVDGWGHDDAQCGVVLSRWSYAEGDYIVIASKFPTVN